MPIIKSYSPQQNLSSFVTFINDTNPNSTYFRITEFNETFTGGKNGFLIEGSEYLKPSTEVKIELLDVNGNPIFYKPGNGIPEYYEGLSKLVSVEIYDDTPIGLGKITILGELEKYVNDDGVVVDVPPEWKGVYNVKWEREFKINKNLANESIVRFVKRPKISISEIEKPIFTKEIPQITQTGSASGIPEIPIEGTILANHTAGTLYKINITDSSNFTSSIDDNVIRFPDINYNATVLEVLNDKTVLVDVPYTVNGLVSSFNNESYTSTFEYPEGATTGQSSLTGSFAEIFINDLKTFVGDVARVKVYRKSRNEVGDFVLVTDTRLESTEILRDLTVANDTELSYGIFSPTNFGTYWASSSNDHPIEFDNTQLFSSIKVDYDSGVGGTQKLFTSRSINFNTDVEYTLKFKTLVSGSLTNDKFLKAYISGSNGFTQSFVDITPSGSYNSRQEISSNIISSYSGSGQLYFEFKGDDWYISNVSLRNAQETSFSPDEFTLIQEVPRKLKRETFDFRFEFYDINNNFIPVEVFATKEFTGGNTDIGQSQFLSFESDRTAFRFTTGSFANPQFQQVGFTVNSNGLTGSVLFTSQAFDTNGNLITSQSYYESGVLEYPGGFSGSYPGLLTNPSNTGATLLLSNFTGSVESITVGSIIYTASQDVLEDFETIFRFEDGDNAPALFATSNANQFIYEPTQLRPKPSGQEIRIQVKRKNLESLITPITANSSSNFPLTEVSDEGGIKTYSISALDYSSSLMAGNDGEYDDINYSFTASDSYSNTFSDEITISPVINFDGISLVLSNESTTFRANSVGALLDDLSEGNGTVSMNIGNQSISHNDGLNSRNTFDIVSVSGTNVTPLSTSPTTNLYGISAMSADNGTLDITIDYLAGDNATSQSFSKKVNYSKNRSAPPTIELTTTNRTQNVAASALGVQEDSFADSTITVKEFYTGSQKSFGSGDVTITFEQNPNSIATDNGNLTLSYDNLADGTNSTQIIFSASVVDSEGTSRDISDSISLSKSPAGSDGEPGRLVSLTFSDNSIAYNADGTNPDPATITLIASSSNFDNPLFKFTGGGSDFTDETTFTAGNGNNDTASFQVPISYKSTPYTFKVEVREDGNPILVATDTETAISVKPGQDTRPRFIIKPLNGTQIKNADRSLELQVVRIDGSGSFDISGSAQGDAEIYSGSVKLSTSLTGITDGGNGAEYNPVIAPSAISGTLELTLKETDGTILDSINLLDVTDGLGGGSFLVPNGLLMRRSGSNYTPSSLGVTASFFDATGSEYRADVLIGSNFNGTLDQMSVTSGSTNPNISITANDGDDNNIPLNGTFANTKDVNIVAVFTESSTGKTNTITETFFIISDGQDGTSAKSIRLSSSHQAFVVAKNGTVTPSEITFTANRQNTDDTSTTFSTSPTVTLTNTGADTRTLTATNFGSNTFVTVTASADSSEVSDEITIVRLEEGSDGLTVINTNQAHTIPSNNQGEVLDLTNSGTTIKVFEGATQLDYDGSGTTAGHFSASAVVNPSGKVTLDTFQDSGNDLVIQDHTDMASDTNSVTITYTLTGKRFNGEDFEIDTTQTLTKSKEGAPAIQVTNTNSSVVVPSDSDGSNPVLTNSGTEIEVFEGDTTLTFTNGTPTIGQYSASASSTNITTGGFTGNGTTTLGVSAHSNMTDETATILYTLSGKRQSGEDFTTTTTQNLTKVRAGSDGVNGVDGADGADGSDGVDARAVNLTATDQSIEYDTAGNNPSPSSVTITATAVNTEGTVYYEFFVNDSSVQNTTTNTYSLTTASDIDNMPQKVEVQIREGSDSGTVLARDQITIFGIKDGSDAYTIILTNEAHTLPTTNTGTVTYTGSGTSIIVYKGTNELDGITSGTPTTGEFSVSAVGSNITPNASPTSTGNPIVYGVASNITSDTAFITFTVNIEDNISVEKIQSFSKSVEGQDGSPGDNGTNAVVINLSPASQTVKRNTDASFDSSVPFIVTVAESGNLLTHTTNSTLSTSQFKITNLNSGSISAGSGTTQPQITPIIPTTSFGFVTEFDITFKDSNDNESSDLPQQHRVSVVLDGQTGPGVVMTGIWESGRDYQASSGSNARRDVVLYSSTGVEPYDTYYAALRQHTAAAANVPDGPPSAVNSTAWEEFGTQDFFVAAKVGIFEDSFVQNTLNIGSNNNGGISSANITLFGGTDESGSTHPYISMGQAESVGDQGYSVGDGIFLGRDDDDDKFKLSIENSSSTNSLKWNGSTLEIAGSITVTGGDAATQTDVSTAADNSLLSSSLADLDLQLTSGMRIENGRELEKVSGGSSWNQSVYSGVSYKDGAYVVFKANKGLGYAQMGLSDNPTADNGLSSLDYAWRVNNNTIQIYKNGIGPVTPDVTLPTVVGQESLKITYDGDKVRFFVDETLYYTETTTANREFYLDSSFFTEAKIITWFDFGPYGQTNSSEKSTGKVGGWSITSTEIQGGSPSGGGDGSNTTQGIRLGATGYISAENFYLDTAGNANFGGTLSAPDGNIGGWTINAGTLAKDTDIVLDSTNRKITLEDGSIQFGILDENTDYYGYTIDITSGIEINSNNYWKNQNDFSNPQVTFKVGTTTDYLEFDGTDVNVSGIINATEGNLGGWEIGPNSLSSVDGELLLESGDNTITIKDDDGTVELVIRSGSISSATTDTAQLQWAQQTVFNETISNSNDQDFNNVTTYSQIDSFTLDEQGTYTVSNLTVSTVVTSLISENGTVTLRPVLFLPSYDVAVGYIISDSSNPSTGNTVAGPFQISSNSWTESDTSVSLIGSTTRTISITNSTPGKVYYIHSYVETSGVFSTSNTGTLDIDVTIDDLPASRNVLFVKSEDIVELTGGGIQVAASATRYVRIPQTNNSQVMFIGGGIELDSGGGSATENGITYKWGTTAEWRIFRGNDSKLNWYYYNGTAGDTEMLLDTVGNLSIDGSLSETSTRKIKYNISNLNSQKDIITKLQPVSYNRVKDDSEDMGLIAEDVHEIAPHLVSYDDDGNPAGIKYTKLSVLLLDVVKTQSEEIEELKQRLNNLENK